MEELISVIIPVYNVEKYIKKCVQSVCHQTYTNLEILIVDDGATDSSGTLCDELAQQDARIRVFHKENGGLSSARNEGVKLAKGEYVLFVDSDDWIHEEMVHHLYTQIKQTDAEVSICGIMNVYIAKTSPQSNKEFQTFTCDSKGFIKELMIGEKIPGSICNKLLKRSIAQQLEFPLGKIYEDAFYQYQLAQTANRYVVSSKPYYYYYHRENSITTKPYNQQVMNCIEIYEQFYTYIIENFKDLEEEAFFRLSYAYFTVYDRMLVSPQIKNIPEHSMVYHFLRKHVGKIVRNPYFRMTRKMASLALAIHPRAYRYLWELDQKKNRGIHEYETIDKSRN